MEEDHKTLGEQQAESHQRAYELGGRYGYLDARAGRPDVPHNARQMGLSGREAELYDQGWHESYDAYMRDLNEPGHHVTIPSPEPGMLASATTTGHTRVTAGALQVGVLRDGVTLWLPADVVRVVR